MRAALERAALKTEAKRQFKAQYGPCVGVQFISLLIPFALSSLTGEALGYEAILEGMTANFWDNIGTFLAYMLLMVLISLLTGAILVETSYFYLRVFRGEKVRVGEFMAGLVTDVGRKVGAYLWMQLFLLLWGMVLVGPLILLGLALGSSDVGVALPLVFACALLALMVVKSLAYSMMLYIVRDCPGVSVRKAMRLSIALMRGHKGKLFVLVLSFFGWMLVSAVTFGVLVLFYVGPYFAVTEAGFYHYIKREGLASGAIAEEELEVK